MNGSWSKMFARCRFDILGKLQSNESAWQERWDGVGELPALIEMRVELHAGDRRVWVPLLIALKLDARIREQTLETSRYNGVGR